MHPKKLRTKIEELKSLTQIPWPRSLFDSENELVVWNNSEKKSLGSKLKFSNITFDLNMSFPFFKKIKEILIYSIINFITAIVKQS